MVMKSDTSRVRVAVIEEQTLLRHLLTHAIVSAEGRFDIVSAAADPATARDACLRIRPDLVVLGPHLSRPDPLQLAGVLTRGLPRSRLLAVVPDEDPVATNRLEELGIAGFVETCQPLEVLQEALCEVAAGRPYRTARFLQRQHQIRSHPESFVRHLTGREQEVLRLVIRGHTSRSVAQRLDVGTRAVEAVRFRLMRKLGVRNVTGLMEYAFRHGLMPDLPRPPA